MGLWRNGSASDSKSEGWAFESLWPHFLTVLYGFVGSLVSYVTHKPTYPHPQPHETTKQRTYQQRGQILLEALEMGKRENEGNNKMREG